MRHRTFKKYMGGFAAATAALVILTVPVGMAGCKKPEAAETLAPAETKEAPADTSEEEKAPAAAIGDASSMIESEGVLYFKYGNAIRAIEKATGEIRKIRTFEESESNRTFWVCGGNLYFDTNIDELEASSGLFGIHKLNLETKEEVHLADLTAQPTSLYASGDILYVRVPDNNIVYQLDEEGKTKGELSPGETIYGKIPEGCKELYSGMLPYYTEHYGYMPVQNDTCLVIADADGSNAREISEVTNTSSAFFAEDCFFVLFRDGKGGSQCWRYDVETLEKTLLFESLENPLLLQYRDGYLYYVVDSPSQLVSSDKTFYRVSGENEAPEKVAEMKDEPGMTGILNGYGNFFAAEDGIYCQKSSEYGVYIGKSAYGTEEEPRLLTPVLYQSPIQSLGHVEAETKISSCACGELEAAEVYAETLVFDGESEAAARMSRTLKERQQEIIAYGETMKEALGEDWIHDDGGAGNSHKATLSFEIGDITFLNSRYCCIETIGYEYSGGAHGTPFKEYFVFDRETGERLGLSDILENSQEELQAMVGKAFRALNEKTNFAFESPEDLEHTVSDDVSYDSEFYLTEEGIAFYYSPYEIAPYAEGFPEVVIPYRDLEIKIDLGQ